MVKLPDSNRIKLATSKALAESEQTDTNRIAITDGGTGIHTIGNESTGTDDVANEERSLLFYGSNPGLWNNDISITFLNYGTSNPSVKEPNSALLSIFYNNILVETFYVSRNPEAKSSVGRSLYIETVLQGSNYVRVLDNSALENNAGDPDYRMPDDIRSRAKFGGGDDGFSITDSVMIDAVKALEPTDRFPIRFLCDSGWTTPAYQKEIIRIVEARDDSIAVIGVPFENVSASNYLSEILEYKNVELNAVSTYAGLYAPHILISDSDNDRQVYVSGVGQVMALWCRQWDFDVPWRPPANENGIINALAVQRTFTDAELDRLADDHINPIRWEYGLGIRLFGEYTLDTRPGPLGRLHARALLNAIKGPLRTSLNRFLFGLNVIEDTGGTRLHIRQIIDTYMQGISNRNGVYDWRTVIDDTNNTSGDVRNRILRISLLVQIVETVEFIPVTIGVTPYGVDFSLAETVI